MTYPKVSAMKPRTTNAIRVLKAIAPYLDRGETFVGTIVAEKLGVTPSLLWERMGQLQQRGYIRKVSAGHYDWDKRPDDIVGAVSGAKNPKPTHTINAYPDIPLSRLMGRR